LRSVRTGALGQPGLTKPTRGFLLATGYFTGRISGMRFTKMHGLGNDFIIFDAPPGGAPDASLIRRLADRFTGIGFDQALMLEPPRRPGTAVYYRIFNADGREVEQCGNGARCIARFLRERAGAAGGEIVLDSPGGLVQTRMQGDQVSVAMGVPDFDPAALPFEASGEAYVYPLPVGASEVEIGAVSIGNPHAVIRVPAVGGAARERPGPPRPQPPPQPHRTKRGLEE
jgi:diaminopimelate epimerase